VFLLLSDAIWLLLTTSPALLNNLGAETLTCVNHTYS